LLIVAPRARGINRNVPPTIITCVRAVVQIDGRWRVVRVGTESACRWGQQHRPQRQKQDDRYRFLHDYTSRRLVTRLDGSPFTPAIVASCFFVPLCSIGSPQQAVGYPVRSSWFSSFLRTPSQKGGPPGGLFTRRCFINSSHSHPTASCGLPKWCRPTFASPVSVAHPKPTPKVGATRSGGSPGRGQPSMPRCRPQ